MSAEPNRFARVLDRLSDWASAACATVAAATLIGLALAGAIDVVGTWLLDTPVPSVREFSSEFLAILIFFSFAHAQLKREHVAVDLFFARFPGGMQRIVEFVSLNLGFVIFAVLAWRLGGQAFESLEMRERAAALVSFPIYPFKFAVAVASAVAALEYLRQIVTHVTAPADAPRLSGEAAERSV
jgi:TRAP-type C4-dicarboxylate transport system permease small subunit